MLSEVKEALSNMNTLVAIKNVTVRLDGYKKELEFFEISTKIYILDNGYRKVNPPYVQVSNLGVSESKPETNNYKLRCYMLTKLVIPGYYREGDLDVNNKNDNFQKFFGKTYRELVAHMAEHNYHHDKNEMYCLNFHEI